MFLPEANHHLVSVSVDGVPVGKPPVYVLSGGAADHSINASFAIDTRKLTYVAGPGGTITGSTTRRRRLRLERHHGDRVAIDRLSLQRLEDGVATPYTRETNEIIEHVGDGELQSGWAVDGTLSRAPTAPH